MGKAKDYSTINWHEHLIYDETSPSGLRWKNNRPSGRSGKVVKVFAGDVVGSLNGKGRWQVQLFGSHYLIHRIIYTMFFGFVGTDLEIDHKDRNPKNNVITNLRAVPSVTNSRNMSKSKKNTTGVTGVSKMCNNNRDWYFVAHWRSLDGRHMCEYFPTSKYGEEGAFKMACDRRSKAIEDLNLLGAGYSITHGMNKTTVA